MTFNLYKLINSPIFYVVLDPGRDKDRSKHQRTLFRNIQITDLQNT